MPIFVCSIWKEWVGDFKWEAECVRHNQMIHENSDNTVTDEKKLGRNKHEYGEKVKEVGII